jgi:hypothetical protein
MVLQVSPRAGGWDVVFGAVSSYNPPLNVRFAHINGGFCSGCPSDDIPTPRSTEIYRELVKAKKVPR